MSGSRSATPRTCWAQVPGVWWPIRTLPNGKVGVAGNPTGTDNFAIFEK